MRNTITYTIELTYCIKGVPEYYMFGKDKHLHNIKTGRKLKQCYNNGSIGFWINKSFISIKNIKNNNLLYKPVKEKFKCPFYKD